MCVLKDVYREIYRFENDLREISDLSVNEAMILCSLREKNSTSGDLAAELSLSPGRMSRILDSLEHKTYIVRSFGLNDRRVINVAITEKGEDCMEKLRASELREPEFVKYIKKEETL